MSQKQQKQKQNQSQKWRRWSNASAMEGTSCADDLRLLHERTESFSSDLVLGGRRSDIINVCNLLGVIEDGITVRLQVISMSHLRLLRV